MRSCSLVVLGCAVALGCGQPPRKVGAQPSWRSDDRGGADGPRAADAGRLALAPARPPARAYNDPPMTPPPASVMGAAIIAAADLVADELGVDPPLADGRLFAAADELATVMPSEGVVPYPAVEFALQHHGIVEPSPHLLVLWGPLDDAAAIVEQVQPRLREVLGHAATRIRLGVGVAPGAPRGDGTVVVALQASAITTRPIPREAALDEVFVVEGEVAPGFANPELFVTGGGGQVQRVRAAVTGSPRAFRAEVACGGAAGRLQVEVAAADHTGSNVLANFPVWCGEPAPSRMELQGPAEAPAATEAEAERRLLALLNDDRRAHGLPALAWDDRVAEVARGHSREMRATGAVGHVSPTTGSAADRVRAAGIRSAAVLENIARAYGVAEAQAGLMNSPGHRANVLAAGVTHAGVGVAFGEEIAGRRELFVTQVFTRVTPPIDAAAETARLRAALAGGRSLGRDAQLDGVAAELAAALAAGRPHAQATAEASRRLDGLSGTYLRVGSVLSTVADPAAIDAAALVGDAAATHVGIGVAQGTHDELGEGAIFVVLLLAVAR